MVKRGNINITNKTSSRGFALDRHATKRILSERSRSKFDNSRVFSLSLSLYFHARRKAMTTNTNTNTNTTTTLYVTPLTSDQCLWCARNNKNKKKNVESQRVHEFSIHSWTKRKKRMRELYAYLRRFCTRRWPLSGTALARRSSCRRCASVRLSICPFF